VELHCGQGGRLIGFLEGQEKGKAPTRILIGAQEYVVVEKLYRKIRYLKAFRGFWEGLMPAGASEVAFRQHWCDGVP
jgi:hypothetical protein